MPKFEIILSKTWKYLTQTHRTNLRFQFFQNQFHILYLCKLGMQFDNHAETSLSKVIRLLDSTTTLILWLHSHQRSENVLLGIPKIIWDYKAGRNLHQKFFRGRKCSFNNRGDYLWQTSNKISLKVRKIVLGLLTGLPKTLFQSSTFSCPCSERKDKNENYLKDTIPKTFFPGLVNISFDIPADILFQKSEKFCSLFEKLLQCKTIFLEKNFLGKLLRSRKVQFWKQLKNFIRCPNFHRSDSENKHKLTTSPKTGPPNEPVDM